ncbi:MAG: hypothetical protein HC847_11330 [Hydrococcus sp. RU_2_2]|nr:hypothetical protein [Hydrococcus sp. RU_2_2]
MSQHQEVFSDPRNAGRFQEASLQNDESPDCPKGKPALRDRSSNEIQFQRYDSVAIDKYISPSTLVVHLANFSRCLVFWNFYL